ncbi:MAG: hypothetical protein GVY19_01175 [Bacteroidetes bacterium]|jgi:hypothetical protein|nr:hypothetical protein [Bacteroidota bacterium]
MSKVYISLTVDWEGEHFHNLKEFIALRKKIGEDIPVSHFICPAYFTGKHVNTTAKKMQPAIFSNDEIHLHIHCYRALVEEAGVHFRTEQNYYRPIPKPWLSLARKYPVLKYLLPHVSGRGVPLTTFNPDEQKAIILYSQQLLQQCFPKHPVNGFRAGGNILNDDTINILHDLHFAFDASATSPSIYSKTFDKGHSGNLYDDYGDHNGLFTHFLLKLWGGVRQEEEFLKNNIFVDSYGGEPVWSDSQPFYLGPIKEIPENCGMTDFVSPDKTAIPVLEKLIDKARYTGKIQYLHYGCHQEGEGYYKQKLLDFIQMAGQYSDNIEYIGMNQCCALFFDAK